jgi:hypothetical protein
MGFTSTRGGQQPLIAWESLPAAAKTALTNTDFGSANVPFKDSNFMNQLAKAYPLWLVAYPNILALSWLVSLFMNLNLALPRSSRLPVQLVRMFGDIGRVEVWRVVLHYTSDAEKRNVNVFAV